MSDIVEDVLKSRYYQNGETCWDDVCHRVSNFLADNEDEKKDYYELMASKKFIPNSPCLFNAGTQFPLMSACFALEIDDSMESIFDCLKKASLLMKAGAGVGFQFSNIRPIGFPVGNSNGIASGVLSFMRVYNEMIDVVKQAGKRRGAAIALLDISHPEIEDFIKCKDVEGTFSNFNISVVLTDDFLKKVEKNEKFDLKFNGVVCKTVNARYLFNTMLEHTHKTGEPGVIFYDNINKTNPNKNLGDIRATNPCIYKDMLLMTPSGLSKISSNNSKIWNGEEYTYSKSWLSGFKNLVKVVTNSGYEYITTPDHKFLLEDGNWERAENLIDLKLKFKCDECEWDGILPEGMDNVNFEILGFEFGDASYHKASGRMKYIYFSLEKDKEVFDIIKNEFGCDYDKTKDELYIKIPYGTVYASAFSGRIENRDIPDWVLRLPKEHMRCFLRGLFSANGCNLKKYHKIQLVSINKNMLSKIQNMLLLFGIKSKLWYHNKETDVTFKNGTYRCKMSYHLVISRISYVKYLEKIGFIQQYKNGYDIHRNYMEEDEFDTVIDVEDFGIGEVWDFEEPVKHCAWFNGVFLHNCGEIPILTDKKTGGGESCNIGSIDVSKFYNNLEFDWEGLRKTIYISTRFLNSVLHKNYYIYDEIKNMTYDTKKIGLGCMGVADLFIKMGMPYGCKESLEFSEKLMEFINTNAIEESKKLVNKYGVYPKWDGSSWCNDNIKIANSILTTNAPTGSVSLFAGCSSGIEPNIKYVYNRSTWASGDKQTYRMVHPMFEEYFSKYDNYEKILNYVEKYGTLKGCRYVSDRDINLFRCSKDVTPKEHVSIQAAFQKHTGNSISKTINCPESTSVKEMEDVLLYAWKSGCKGVTLYRDGSRKIEVISSIHKDTTLEKPKIYEDRPDTLFGGTYSRRSGCGKLYLTVNYNDNIPYEVFAFSGGSGGCQAQNEALGRLISLGLQNGIDYKHMVKQLKKVKCPVAIKNARAEGKSCADIIGDILLKSMGDDDIKEITRGKEEHIFSGMKCPDCGEELNFVEGCRTCYNCGWSKCI